MQFDDNGAILTESEQDSLFNIISNGDEHNGCLSRLEQLTQILEANLLEELDQVGAVSKKDGDLVLTTPGVEYV